MTNYQTAIIDEIKSRLEAMDVFKLVGEYPEDNSLFGNNYPVAFVMDGDEKFISGSAGLIESTYRVTVFFSVQARNERIKTVTDLQVAIISALLDDFTLGGLSLISVDAVLKGEFSNTLGKFDVGYNETITNRKIIFEIGVCNYAN